MLNAQQITEEELKLIARLPQDPAYSLLCDHLQAYVDDLAVDMAADGLSNEAQLQKLAFWKASRRLLETLRDYPEQLRKDLDEHQPKRLPAELSIDPVYLAYRRQHLQANDD